MSWPVSIAGRRCSAQCQLLLVMADNTKLRRGAASTGGRRLGAGRRRTSHEGLEVAGELGLQLVHAVGVLEGADVRAHRLLHARRARAVHLPLRQAQHLACTQARRAASAPCSASRT